MTPLTSLLPNERNYSWLLWGTEKEVHTIHGATGLSPKLLHTFAQITRLCEQMSKTPESLILPMGAKKIRKLLENFRQRSELSEGYETTSALMASCEDGLDENGKVTEAKKVTELTGECWVCAAKIYLHCRFFR
jgi:Fungal specific transcription factor domain